MDMARANYYVVVLAIALVLVMSHDIDGVTRRINRRTRRINAKVSSVLAKVKELYNAKDTCNCESTLQSMTSKLDNISTHLSHQTGSPDIDLTDDESVTVQVEVPEAYERCLAKFNSHPIEKENARKWCLRQTLWRHSHYLRDDDNGDDDDPQILQLEEDTVFRSKRGARNIRRIAPRNDMTQPPTGFRTRQEYRTLTVDQRNRFHNALNVLYWDGTIDCFSRVHRTALRRGGAHRGAAFLAWHRAFIAMFEEALRQVDDTVALPYWDSSIDDNMPAGPVLSVIWDEDHLGDGIGVVDNGPFASWVNPEGPLLRDIGSGTGSTVRQSRIDFVMGFCTHEAFRRRWENTHNGVHRWVGGTMARGWAPNDPVFYMVHAFIDYQWEKFREQQWADCNIDPTYDYPPPNTPDHHPFARMDGMRFLDNVDGIARYWTENWYKYADTPSCQNNCYNSSDMFCDPERNMCVSNMRFYNATEGSRKKRQVETDNAYRLAAYSNDCSKDPYADVCVKRFRPETEAEIIDAIIQKEVRTPSYVEKIQNYLKTRREKAEMVPPDNGEIVFRASEDEESDKKTRETCVYELVKAIAEGKKLSAETDAKDSARAPDLKTY